MASKKADTGFQHGGFYYSKKELTPGGHFKKKGCRGSCVLLNDKTVKLGSKLHTCQDLVKKRKARDTIKEIFSKPYMKNVGVAPVVDEILQEHQEAAVKMKTENAYKVARYHRDKQKDPIPLPPHRKTDTLESIGKDLEASGGIDYMYGEEQHKIEFKLIYPKAGTQAGITLMAYDKKLVEKYGGAEKVNEDATYDSNVSVNGCYQLCTTMVEVEGEGLPIMWAFMENKSEDSYTQKFEWQRDTFPNFRPKQLMSDFEAAIRNAFIKTFENARLIGCKFHYNKAIWVNATKHGIADKHFNRENNPKSHKQLRKLMALIHLPPEDYERGYDLIKEETLEMYDNHRDWVKYFGYSDRQWLARVNGTTMSVYGVDETTNNIIERYHKLLLALVHAHPDIKRFLRGLIALLLKKLLRLDQIRNGLEHVKKLSPEQKESKDRIAEAVETYTNEKKNNVGTDEERIKKLLDRCSYFKEEELDGFVPEYLVSAADIDKAECIWIGEGTEGIHIDERTGVLHCDAEMRKSLNEK